MSTIEFQGFEQWLEPGQVLPPAPRRSLRGPLTLGLSLAVVIAAPIVAWRYGPGGDTVSNGPVKMEDYLVGSGASASEQQALSPHAFDGLILDSLRRQAQQFAEVDRVADCQAVVAQMVQVAGLPVEFDCDL